MKQLESKVAIVTGASSGIGYASARLFAQEGARVVVAARRQKELDALVARIRAEGGEAVAIAGDVGDEDFARATVALAVSRYGGLDVALNNAGTGGAGGPTSEVALAGWQETLTTNLTSAFLGAKYQIPAMLARGGGSIVFTSSILGYTVAFPGVAAYAASKSGLVGLAQALAVELGPKNIRVNALVPGAVDTPMYREMNATDEAKAFVNGLHALKRAATPEELACSALYLASSASSFTTGTALLVDGGISINHT